MMNGKRKKTDKEKKLILTDALNLHVKTYYTTQKKAFWFRSRSIAHTVFSKCRKKRNSLPKSNGVIA